MIMKDISMEWHIISALAPGDYCPILSLKQSKNLMVDEV